MLDPKIFIEANQLGKTNVEDDPEDADIKVITVFRHNEKDGSIYPVVFRQSKTEFQAVFTAQLAEIADMETVATACGFEVTGK